MAESLNKDQLIETLAKSAGFTKGDAALFLNHMIAIFEKCAANGIEINVRGFGRLYTQTIKAHTTVNPFDDNREIEVPETKRVIFRLAENIRRADSQIGDDEE